MTPETSEHQVSSELPLNRVRTALEAQNIALECPL
jgi:hypothetical protein